MDERNVKRDEQVCVLVGLGVFLGSLFMSGLYVAGDQVGYYGAYSSVSGMGWNVGRELYEDWISSKELMHYLAIFVGSGLGIDKNLFMSLINGILAGHSMRLFMAWGADLRVASFVVLTNYYFLVVYFAAERLKFGILFLVLSVLFMKRRSSTVLFLFASLWSHFSMLFIYAGMWLARSFPMFSRLNSGMTNTYVFLVLPAFMVVFGIALEYNYLVWKVGQYIDRENMFNFVKLVPVTILLVFSCFYAKRIIEPVLFFLPVIVGISLLGGDRLNMLAYCIFLYYGLGYNGGVNVGVLVSSAYLSYKAYGFVLNTVNSGSGFA